MDLGDKNKLVERLITWPFWLCLILHTLYTLLNAKPIGDDSYLHPMWLELFSEQFRAGDLYPRWLFETYGSFGSPTFYLYPPLTYFFGTVISLLGIDSGVTLYNIVQYVALLLSGYTSYLLLKDLGVARKIATMGALVYAFNPYHFADVFARSALSEHVALAFLPLVFLGIERISQRDKRVRGTVLMLTAWSLLILTNIPTLCIAGIGALAMLFTKRDGKLFAYTALAFIGALAITAFYWMPAYHFSQFTRTDALWSIADKAIPDQIALATFIAIALTLLALWIYRQKSDRQQIQGWVLLAAIALVMQLPYVTDWLYTVMPLKLVQFNWRFVMLAMLALPILMMRNTRFATISLVVIGVSTLMLYIAYGYQHLYKGDVAYYEQPIKRDAPEYTTKWVPYADSVLIPFLQQHENDSVITGKQEDYLTVIGSRIGPSNVGADVTASSSVVRLHQFYWPEWKITFNYQDLPISHDEHGFLTTTLPSDHGKLRATLRESSVERISKWISLVSIMIVAGMCVFIRRHT